MKRLLIALLLLPLLTSAASAQLSNVPVSATADLPAPGSGGARVRQLTDGTRGIVVDTGTQWVELNGKVFNVRLFGAKGDGKADDTSAVNAAIAALNLAGRGVLYFPASAGGYKVTAALTPIKALAVVRGDGASTVSYVDTYNTLVFTTSGSANLFTVSSYYAKFENIALANTSARTPTAGAGIYIESAGSNNRCDLDSVLVEGFYINADVKTGGGAWSFRNSLFVDAVATSVRVNNVINADSGDWSISDCSFWQLKRPANAAVRTEGSGGGKITNCKFNGLMGTPNQFTDCVRAQPQASSILLISNCSFENFGGAKGGIGVVTQLSMTTISNCQFGVYNTNSFAIYAGNTNDFTLSGVNIVGAGQGIAAIYLENLGNANIGPYTLRNFGGGVQVAGTYTGTLIPGESTLGALSIRENTLTPHFQVSHVGNNALLKNITVPYPQTSQTACFIPDSAFNWDTSGNIAPGGSGTAVVGRTLCFTWSATAGKWYASY
jgi:hypothetical protein